MDAPILCTFCGNPVETPGFIDPEMCDRCHAVAKAWLVLSRPYLYAPRTYSPTQDEVIAYLRTNVPRFVHLTELEIAGYVALITPTLEAECLEEPAPPPLPKNKVARSRS